MSDFDQFLRDHANCERKASALAMSMVVKYPDRSAIIPSLIELAREELDHFQRVYTLLEQRGLRLVRDSQDEYVRRLLALMRHGRDQRFVDRLLIASLIECRGAERFRLLAVELENSELGGFYRELAGTEARHGHVFVELLLRCQAAEQVYPRLRELAEHEAQIMLAMPIRAALH